MCVINCFGSNSTWRWLGHTTHLEGEGRLSTIQALYEFGSQQSKCSTNLALNSPSVLRTWLSTVQILRVWGGGSLDSLVLNSPCVLRNWGAPSVLWIWGRGPLNSLRIWPSTVQVIYEFGEGGGSLNRPSVLRNWIPTVQALYELGGSLNSPSVLQIWGGRSLNSASVLRIWFGGLSTVQVFYKFGSQQATCSTILGGGGGLSTAQVFYELGSQQSKCSTNRALNSPSVLRIWGGVLSTVQVFYEFRSQQAKCSTNLGGPLNTRCAHQRLSTHPPPVHCDPPQVLSTPSPNPGVNLWGGAQHSVWCSCQSVKILLHRHQPSWTRCNLVWSPIAYANDFFWAYGRMLLALNSIVTAFQTFEVKQKQCCRPVYS